MNVPKFCMERRAISIAVMLVFLIWGIVTYYTMSRREDPEIVIRAAQLVTIWPGAEVDKIEQLVTRPLEMAIKEVAEVDEIKSDSRVGLSSIIIKVLQSVDDVETVWTKIRAKLARVQPTLPEGCLTPNFDTDFGDVAVMLLAMYQSPMPGQTKIAYPYTMRQMDDFLKEVEDIIQAIPMVGKIEKYGLQQEVVYIEADAREWGQLAISAQQLAQILQGRNIVAPGGVISTPNHDYTIKPSGEFLSPEQIKSVLVGVQNGSPIHLGELNFTISRRYEEPPSKYTRFCSPDYIGKDKRCPCVILSFSMRSGYNVVELGNLVRKKIREISQTILPPDLHLEVVSDIPSRVDESVNEFIQNLWEAIIIVVLVALLMIGFRGSMIMAAAIPLSMITGIGTMSLFHVDLEQCSIAALIIALGMLVDNAVVISDNVIRLISLGVPKKEACWKGANELFIPVLNSTLTTVAAFLPMLTIPGDTGDYIRSLPIMVSSTLMISLFVAMTITPMMCYLMLSEADPNKKGNPELLPHEPIQKGILGWYGRLIGWSLDHQFLLLFLALVIFCASLCLVPVIGTAFFPKGLRNQFVVEINLPAGSSIAQTDRVVAQVEDILLKHSTIKENGKTIHRLKNSIAYIGLSGPRFFLSIKPQPPKPYFALIMVNTHSKWYSQGLMDDIKPELLKIVGAQIVIRPLDMGPPLDTPVNIRIRGQDPQLLLHFAKEVEARLEKIPGTDVVHNSWGSQSYQLAVDVSEDAANLAGVSHIGIANTLYGYFNGIQLTTYREGRHEIGVVIRVKPEQRRNLEYLDYLYVEGQRGKVPLNAIAKVTPTWQMSLIQRRNLIRTIEVRSFLKEGYLTSKIIAQVMPILHREILLPPGYTIEVGGEFEETQKSQGDVINALQIALVLILLPLIFQFNSFLKSLIIFVTMPLSVVGALLGLWISGWPLGFMPILGMVSLCGVVVNNAILLLDFIENAAAQGMPLRTALICSGQIRMRPIFITSLTTVAGFVPLAIFGGPLWEGMAYVMIFGLLISTLLTLVVIPTVFLLFVQLFKMRVVTTISNE